MTAERWLPIPYDDTPYANAPGEKVNEPAVVDRRPRQGAAGSLTSTDAPGEAPLVAARDASPGAPVTPAACLPPGGPSHTGAPLFQCATCLLEWDEPYCDWCGATLTPNIDRLARLSLPGPPREADKERV